MRSFARYEIPDTGLPPAEMSAWHEPEPDARNPWPWIIACAVFWGCVAAVLL